jgi:hypothetical protein
LQLKLPPMKKYLNVKEKCTGRAVPWRSSGEWTYSSTILNLTTKVRFCHLHAPAALPPVKQALVATG